MKTKIFLILFLFVSVKIFAQTENVAPNFKTVDLYGKQFELYSSTKPKIIQFTRVYCGGKISEQSATQFGQLAKIYDKYKDKILFVTITLSSCQSSDFKKNCRVFWYQMDFYK